MEFFPRKNEHVKRKKKKTPEISVKMPRISGKITNNINVKMSRISVKMSRISKNSAGPEELLPISERLARFCISGLEGLNQLVLLFHP